jgi:hypothetical protein
MADSRIPADVSDAVYRVVHDFGAEKLAARTGTPAGTIYNKANPHDTSHHKPTLSDALIWSQIAGDRRIAHAFCRALGGVFVDLSGMARQSDKALLDLALRRDKEFGEFAGALLLALEDGRISGTDYAVLRREGYEAVTAMLELLSRLEAMAHG